MNSLEGDKGPGEFDNPQIEPTAPPGRLRKFLGKLGLTYIPKLEEEYEERAFPSTEELGGLLYGERLELIKDNPELRQKISFTLGSAKRIGTRNLFFECGIDIINTVKESNLTQGNTKQALFDYLNFCLEIDRIKIKAVGVQASTARSNGLQRFLAVGFVESLGDNYDLVTDCVKNAASLGTYLNDYPSVGWFMPKLRMLEHHLAVKQNALAFVDNYSSSRRRAGTPEEIEQEDEKIEELFKEIMQKRSYGVKESYREASLGGSWVYHDGQSLRDDVPGYKDELISPFGVSKIAMQVFHSLKNSFDAIVTDKIAEEYGKIGVKGQFFGASISGLGPDLVAYLFTDGQLYLDTTGVVSLKEMFAQKGSLSMYRALQAEHISNFFDLTMPAEVVDAIGGAKMLKPKHIGVAKDAINELVIPRLRYLNQSESAEQIKASEEAEASRESGSKFKLHGVVYHRRRLPDGWHATPKARALAKEYNIELAENETFVSPHSRGDAQRGQIVGHRTRNRRKSRT